MEAEDSGMAAPHSVLSADTDLTLEKRSAANAEPVVGWNEFIDELLPDAPDSSKFTKLDFVSPCFTVDSFIEKRRDEALDKMRHLLTIYAARIRAASVSIISEEHLDLIHFASQLSGLGKAVDKVLLPLSKAHDDVLIARNDLSALTLGLDQRLNRLRQVRKMKSDIEKMLLLDQRLQDLTARVTASAAGDDDDEVRDLIVAEKLAADLFQAERMLQSISTKSKFLFKLKDRFSHIVLDIERSRRLK